MPKPWKNIQKKNYFRPTDPDFFNDVKPKAQVFFCPKYIKFTLSNFHLQISSTVTSIEWDGQISDIYPYTLLWHHRIIYTAYELAVRAWQLDSVAQLVSALHQNHRAASSIPGRGRIRYVYSTLNVGTQTIYSVLGPPVYKGRAQINLLRVAVLSVPYQKLSAVYKRVYSIVAFLPSAPRYSRSNIKCMKNKHSNLPSTNPLIHYKYFNYCDLWWSWWLYLLWMRNIYEKHTRRFSLLNLHKSNLPSQPKL
jgi:hypothetical protein